MQMSEEDSHSESRGQTEVDAHVFQRQTYELVVLIEKRAKGIVQMYVDGCSLF